MPSPRILVLGATGGLGRALVRSLSSGHETTGWGRVELDLERPESIAAALSRHDFDVLLNPAGLTSPDVCEEQPGKALLANVAGPQALAEFCQQRGARMVHFSTDYVFSGTAQEPLTEEDETEPVNHYGRTKRAGELAVLQACQHALVARVSWLFGPDKASHPDHIIQRALKGEELTAVADKVSVPTSNADICGWIELLIRNRPDVNGVLHLCNSGSASWHSWAEAALEAARKTGLPVGTAQVRPIQLAELSFLKAPRPLMTIMSNAKLQNILGMTVRDWREALEEYVGQKYPTA
ncbi:MAG: dTDP-4-dehydrorhamnose reductase [Prosthecobacter sp.]